MYKIVLTARAVKDLEQINVQEKQKIASKLQQYAHDPKHYARRLTNSRLGDYRFRIGDYRVVFDIENHQLIILRIGLRKDIYK
ncbi:MAG: type II toxin-antitoxin system RelE/ParE family toxin [Pseudomonadota bacterium]|nr:type II toxin-antitoxin system RelE/ParE family toxin [Pseudomonadota bacterium]